MLKNGKLSYVYVQLAAFAILSIAFLAGLDVASRKILDDSRTIRLKSYSEAGLDRITVDLHRLELDVEKARQEVATRRNRSYPRLRQFEDLCRKHHLKLERTERVSSAGHDLLGASQYTTTLHGSVGSIVRFLRQLESDYNFSSEHVLLYPVDNDGTLIALSLSLLIKEDEG